MPVPDDAVGHEVICEQRTVAVAPAIPSVADVEHASGGAGDNAANTVGRRQAYMPDELVAPVHVIHVHSTIREGVLEMAGRVDKCCPGRRRAREGTEDGG